MILLFYIYNTHKQNNLKLTLYKSTILSPVVQVHSGCVEQLGRRCPLSQCRVSILLPTAINSMDGDGYWEASRPPGTSPLLVFINTKSGDNQVCMVLAFSLIVLISED